ncbi:DMT family transporter [Candidatus Dependentiae bacterium]
MFFLVVLMYGLMGLAFPLGKWAVACALSPSYVIAFRMIPTGLAFVFYHFYKTKQPYRFRWSDLWLFFVVGATGVYLHLVPEYWSLKYIDSIKANFIYSLSPFITALLSSIIISEKLGKKQWIALAMGFLGMFPVIFTSNPGEAGLKSLFSISVPELAMLLSTFALAFAWFSVKKLSATGHSLHLINGMGMLVGGVLSAVHFFVFHGFQPFPVSDPVNFLWLSLVLVLVSNITTYNMYSFLLKKFSATFLSFSGFLLPIFGALYGKLIWSEKTLNWNYAAALILISVGLWLFHAGSRERGERSHL